MKATTTEGTRSIPTRTSLLRGLANPENDESWGEFTRTYGKLVRGLALQSGLTPDEADEAMHETMISVSRSIRDFHYDRRRSSFKTWLGVLAKRRIVDRLRERPPRGRFQELKPDPSTPTDPLAKIPDPAALDPDHYWDAEYEKTVQEVALDKLKGQVKPLHFQMFYLYVIKKKPAGDVARALGVKVGQVYLVKLRLVPVLKKIVGGLQRGLI